ncbi:MAG TPA: translocation/assembly module TamB domain-containing protein, partial [Hydrogenophaga sp.]
KGEWQPTTSANPAAGLLRLDNAQLAIADAVLDAQGHLDTEALSYEGRTTLQLPGGQIDIQGLLAHARGEGKGRVEVADAKRLLDWVRSLDKLPLVGEAVKSALAGQEALTLNGGATAELQWSGGLGALGWPAPPQTEKTAAAPPLWPKLNASLDIPRLSIQNGETPEVAISQLKLTASGPAQALQISAAGRVAQGDWQAELETRGDAQLSPQVAQAGQLQLNGLSLRLRPVESGAANAPGDGWQVGSAEPLTLRWSRDNNNSPALDAGAGQLRLTPLNPKRTTSLTTPLSLAWQRLTWQGGALDTQGRLEGLTVAWLEALAATPQAAQPEEVATNRVSAISGDLVFDGAWNVHLPTDAQSAIDLSATLQRRSGDLRWESGPATSPVAEQNGLTNERIPAGIKDARISLVIKDRKARAALRWDTERLGRADAEFSTSLAQGRTDGALLDRLWPADTPISGTAQANLPEVGVWSMLAPPGWRMRGTLNANATVGGTRDKPVWQGRIEANELALRSVVDGFAFTNGQLRASLAGDRLNVERFSLQGPGGEQSGGSLEASGQAEWLAQPGSNLHRPVITLQATAQRLRVSNRVDRRLALSGDVNAELTGDQLRLRGQLKVDSAQIILPDELAPSLGKDVVVRSTRTLPTDSAANVVKPDVQVTLDLGQQFQVRGQGIDTRLEGQLTVRATPSLPVPRATGEVRTVSGTYKAYGQQLNIETGVLRFTGPYDDPALDILAVRKLPENTEQRVGVQIKGNAQAPRVSLYSEPALTDGEALAWLVLGRPASAAGAQAFVLQQAARQLLARGGAADEGTLAKTLGVDEVGFADAGGNADGTATQTALTVGKRLSDRLYLSYEQSLSGAMSTVSILYDLSRSLTLRARAGTENAIDLIFTHRYE